MLSRSYVNLWYFTYMHNIVSSRSQTCFISKCSSIPMWILHWDIAYGNRRTFPCENCNWCSFDQQLCYCFLSDTRNKAGFSRDTPMPERSSRLRRLIFLLFAKSSVLATVLCCCCVMWFCGGVLFIVFLMVLLNF